MEIKFILSFYLNLVVVFASEKDAAALRSKLLEHYDKTLRPVVNDSDTTKVKLAYWPQHILMLNEKTETLMTDGFVHLDWVDEHLKWNPDEYNNLTHVHFGDHEIWQPDIHLFYSAGSNSINQAKDGFLFVDNTGEVNWFPLATFEVPCVTNYKYFPYDKHSCNFEFGSWTHSGDSIFLNVYDQYELDAAHIGGAEWKMEKYYYSAVEYFMGNNYPYNSINFTMVVRRTSSLYKLTTVVPIVSSAMMTLASFWLELWTTPRYVVGIANFAMVALHLLSLATSLPAGKDIPLLAQFSATSVCLAMTFLLETVALDSTQRRRDAPPESLVRLARNVPDSILCALPLQSNPTASDDGEEKKRSIPKSDWHLVCVVFDRLFFYVFSFVYIIVTSLLLSV